MIALKELVVEVETNFIETLGGSNGNRCDEIALCVVACL
jgi:hypothetical protein